MVFAFSLPAVGHVFSGFEFLGSSVTAIPSEFTTWSRLDNVESAAVAGDEFPTTRVLTADGVVSLVGCLMGNLHQLQSISAPGWKAMGTHHYSGGDGRRRSSVLVWARFLSCLLIPTIAILPILLYIGMLIGSQAFQETPKRHAPAIILALTPHLAHWAVTLMNGALASVGTFAVTDDLAAKMRDQGVLYRGLEILGGGSILGGLILGAIAVCIIDRNFMKGAGFALAGAILTFFGFMHGHQIGIAQDPTVAFSYLIVAVIFAGCAARGRPEVKRVVAHGEHSRNRPLKDLDLDGYKPAGAFSNSETRLSKRPAAPPSGLDDQNSR